MAAETDIANLALQKLGGDDQITAIDDVDSHAARTLKAAWAMVRQATIRGAGRHLPKWNFALRQAQLAARAIGMGAPLPYGWAAAFPFPDQCLRICDVLDARGATPNWKLVGRDICADSVGPLNIWFLIDVADTTQWDALFVETFAARLAYQVGDRLTGDRQRKADCYNEFMANLASAAAVDAREDPPIDFEEDDWVTARWAGGGWGARVGHAG